VVCPFSNQRDVSYHLHGPREHFRHSAGYVSGVWIKQNRNGSSFFSVRMGIRARSSTGWMACRLFRAEESSPKYCFVLVAHDCRNRHGQRIFSLFIVRFVFGLGEAGAFPTASRAMQLWFPKQERGFIQGVTHCFSRLAVAVTPFVAVAIMSAFGWRWVFYSFALIGALWAIWFAIVYRNRPQEHPGVNAAELDYIRGTEDAAVHSMDRQTVPWKRIMTSPNMWYIAAAYFCFFYGSFFYVTWFPTYLLEYRHLSLQSVGVLATIPLITAMIGDIAGGILTDSLFKRTNRLTFSRRAVAAPALLGAAVFLVPAATASSALTAIICLAASNFFLEMVLGPAWAVPMDVAGPSSGTVTGVMNMTGAVGASISPLVFGMLVQRGSWTAPFFVTAAVLILGALIWILLLNPEKSVVSETGN